MTLDAAFVQGNDIVLEITVTDEDGNPVDITGSSIQWSLKRDFDSSAALTRSTGGSGVTITNGAGGVFQVAISKTQSVELSGEYIHEAVITDALSKVRTITDSDNGFGKITVRKRITPAT